VRAFGKNSVPYYIFLKDEWDFSRNLPFPALLTAGGGCVSSSRTLQTCDPTATGATVRHAEGTSPSSPSVSRPLYGALHSEYNTALTFVFWGASRLTICFCSLVEGLQKALMLPKKKQVNVFTV
jgi:hypothetical protein